MQKSRQNILDAKDKHFVMTMLVYSVEIKKIIISVIKQNQMNWPTIYHGIF